MLFRTYWVVEAARAALSDGHGQGKSEGGVAREVRGELEGERELAFDYALAAVALAVKVRCENRVYAGWADGRDSSTAMCCARSAPFTREIS